MRSRRRRRFAQAASFSYFVTCCFLLAFSYSVLLLACLK